MELQKKASMRGLKRNIRYSLVLIVSVLSILIIWFIFPANKKDNSETIYSSDDIILTTPSISPDGTLIAFGTMSSSTQDKLILINMKNGEVRSFLNEEPVQGLSWSADSVSIIYAISTISEDKSIKYLLKKLTIEEGKESVITALYDNLLSIKTPIFKEGLLFSEILPKSEVVEGKKFPHSTLWYMDVSNAQIIKISDGLMSIDYNNLMNNAKVVFARGRIENNKLIFDLYLKNITTNDEKLLIPNVDVWFMKNESIIYLQMLDKHHEIARFYLRDFKKISVGIIRGIIRYPSLSPDGAMIAFSRKGQIWIVNLKTMKEKQLTRNDESKNYPIWTKDGKYIIYATKNKLMKILAN